MNTVKLDREARERLAREYGEAEAHEEIMAEMKAEIRRCWPVWLAAFLVAVTVGARLIGGGI